jgi:hypothetical protein
MRKLQLGDELQRTFQTNKSNQRFPIPLKDVVHLRHRDCILFRRLDRPVNLPRCPVARITSTAFPSSGLSTGTRNN